MNLVDFSNLTFETDLYRTGIKRQIQSTRAFPAKVETGFASRNALETTGSLLPGCQPLLLIGDEPEIANIDDEAKSLASDEDRVFTLDRIDQQQSATEE